MENENKPADSGSRDAELEFFKKIHCNGFDLSETTDAWGRPVFKQPYIEAMFHGWLKRAGQALVAESSEIAVTDEMVEAALKANYQDIDFEYRAIEHALKLCHHHVVRGWMRAAITLALKEKK